MPRLYDMHARRGRMGRSVVGDSLHPLHRWPHRLEMLLLCRVRIRPTSLISSRGDYCMLSVRGRASARCASRSLHLHGTPSDSSLIGVFRVRSGHVSSGLRASHRWRSYGYASWWPRYASGAEREP